MKLKKVVTSSLAMLLVFGNAIVIGGCDKDNTSSLESKTQYKIYQQALASGATNLTYEEWLVTIKGEKGDTGDTPIITIGSNGNWYIDGVDSGTKAQGQAGADATKWTATSSVPSDNMGNDGDLHLNLTTQAIYKKENGHWVEKAVVSDGENGEDGKEVSFQLTGTHIQWGYLENGVVTNWHNLIELSKIKGEPGQTLKIQKTTTHIQYSYDGTVWYDLISLDILKGKDGKTPTITIVNNKWHVDGVDTGVSALGEQGVSVVDVSVNADKWGIKITHVFEMSDGTSKETSYTVVDPFRVYAAETEDDLKQLIEYGVSSIGLLNNIEVSESIDLDRKITLKLNGFEVTVEGDSSAEAFNILTGGELVTE